MGRYSRSALGAGLAILRRRWARLRTDLPHAFLPSRVANRTDANRVEDAAIRTTLERVAVATSAAAVEHIAEGGDLLPIVAIVSVTQNAHDPPRQSCGILLPRIARLRYAFQPAL